MSSTAVEVPAVLPPTPTAAPSAVTPIEPEPTLFEMRHRFTVEEYHRMAEAEVFGPDARLELIEGVIIDKMVKSGPHVIATMLIERLFPRLVPAEYSTTAGNPLQIEGISEPEPDIQVVRGSPRDLAGRPPSTREVVLAIEVAETSYRRDRGPKWRLYAAARVPAYWILDLNRRLLEVHTAPTGEGDDSVFRKTELFGPDDEVPLVLDGAEVARFRVAEILP